MELQWFLPFFGLHINTFCFLHFFYGCLNLEYFLYQQFLLA